MKTSLGEEILRELIGVRYKGSKILYNHRPESLRNPKTGRKLELDIYLPKKRLAYEFQGSQHANYYQSFKDEVKVAWAHKHKVKLIVVWGKDLIKTAKYFASYGCRYSDELTQKIIAYHAKTYWINKKLHLKSKGNQYAKKKARFHLKVNAMKHVQTKENEHNAKVLQAKRSLKRTPKNPYGYK